MRRVHSVVHILIAAALLAACAPAAPVPTAVPPTVTAAPTNTVAPTATLAPSLTPIPTEVPTPVPTQEDFSGIEIAYTFEEAMGKKIVSIEDVLDGKLIRYAIENVPTDWPEGAEPITWSFKDISGEGDIIFYPDQDNPNIKLMGTYRVGNPYDGEYDGTRVNVYGFLQPNGKIGYYQVTFNERGFDKSTLKVMNREPYLPPHLKGKYQDHNIEMIKKSLELPGYKLVLYEYQYIDYYEIILPMMNEWEETDIIPEELSKIPLYPATISRFK
jgi:hypothetical protein